MPNIILIALLYSLIIITGGGFAYAQKPPQHAQLPATPPEEASPQPEIPAEIPTEIPKQISTVIVENNRLSVEFSNVSFGEILNSIGKKAGFRVEGFSKASNKKVTTKFNDLDIDSGIIRLFSLVKESNYLVNYDTKGSISKIRIYNISAVGSPGGVGSTGIVGSPGSAGSLSQPSSPTEEDSAVPFRAWRSRRRRNLPPTPAPQTPQPGTPTQ